MEDLRLAIRARTDQPVDGVFWCGGIDGELMVLVESNSWRFA